MRQQMAQRDRRTRAVGQRRRERRQPARDGLVEPDAPGRDEAARFRDLDEDDETAEIFHAGS
jgi:hypothetical protein